MSCSVTSTAAAGAMGPDAASQSASVPCISSIAIAGVPRTSVAPKTNTQCS